MKKQALCLLVSAIMLMPSLSFSKADKYNWILNASLGTFLEPYDKEVNSQWSHETFESPILSLEGYRGIRFSQNEFQFLFGGGITLLQSVENISSGLSDSKLTSRGVQLITKAALIYSPMNWSGFGFGASAGIILYEDINTRINSAGLDLEVNESTGIPYFNDSRDGENIVDLFPLAFWMQWKVGDHWVPYWKIEKSSGLEWGTSSSLGVFYVF
ncbi:MAG: hypothetical protein AAF203_04030 [Pseudomonadota bacterium]